MSWRLDHVEHGRLVPQIHFLEDVFRMAADLLEVGQMPGVGEAVQVDQPLDLGPVDDVLDQVGADEAGAAGNQSSFIVSDSVHSNTCFRLSSQSGSLRPKGALQACRSTARSRPAAAPATGNPPW